MLGVDSLCFPRKKKHLPRSICLTKHWNIKLQLYRFSSFLSTLLVAWGFQETALTRNCLLNTKRREYESDLRSNDHYLSKKIYYVLLWLVSIKSVCFAGKSKQCCWTSQESFIFRKITDTAIFCRFQTCPKGFQYPPAEKKNISSFYNYCSYRWST